MMIPSIDDFKQYAVQGNLIPVYTEILADADTPVTAFLKLGGSPSFLLESLEGGEKWARYSFLGSRPAKIIRGSGRRIEIIDQATGTRIIDSPNPFDFIRKEIAAYTPVPVPGLPRFYGGLVGYIGYDMVRCFEEIPEGGKEGIEMPDFFLMLTDTIIIFDSLKQKIKVVSNADVRGKDPSDAYREAEEKIGEIISRLRRPFQRSENSAVPAENGFRSNVSEDDFKSMVVRAKEYIGAGDIFQVVLSQRFRRSTSVSPFQIYRALRVINPSPYMFYMDIGDAQMIGSSPEILVRVEDGKIILRPIAGTRKRGETDARDRMLEEELKQDPKEIAEHIMLVDLGRNDVGRVAAIGSVHVTEPFTVERYSHVMHLVSNVEGSLRPDLDAFDVLAACFPAGTVTGAPKVRAMEIIEELEPSRRGPYAGAVGYFSYTGNMDMCITIRTLFLRHGEAFVQAGAGIVADSVPEREFKETVNKAKGMITAVEMAEGGLL